MKKMQREMMNKQNEIDLITKIGKFKATLRDTNRLHFYFQ